MSDLIIRMMISFDGFIATPKGDVSWITPAFDDELTTWGLDSLLGAGVHVMGGETGRGLATYWVRPDIEERDKPFQKLFNEAPKVVFSKTIDHLYWQATRIAKGELKDEIQRLKHENSKYILVHGGARFCRSLAREHLVDEYQMLVHPVFLGEGLSIFPKTDEPTRLKLVSSRPFKSGAILQTYRPA